MQRKCAIKITRRVRQLKCTCMHIYVLVIDNVFDVSHVVFLSLSIHLYLVLFLECSHKSLYERRVTNSRLVADFIAWRIVVAAFTLDKNIETSGIPAGKAMRGRERPREECASARERKVHNVRRVERAACAP